MKILIALAVIIGLVFLFKYIKKKGFRKVINKTTGQCPHKWESGTSKTRFGVYTYEKCNVCGKEKNVELNVKDLEKDSNSKTNSKVSNRVKDRLKKLDL